MKRNEIISEVAPECPIRNVLARIADKWSLLVLYTLENHSGGGWPGFKENICGSAAESGIYPDRKGRHPSAAYRQSHPLGKRKYAGHNE